METPTPKSLNGIHDFRSGGRHPLYGLRPSGFFLSPFAENPVNAPIDVLKWELIAPVSVRELACAGVVSVGEAVSSATGWVLHVRVAGTERTVRMTDTAVPRQFASLDALTRYAGKLGLVRVQADVPAPSHELRRDT